MQQPEISIHPLIGRLQHFGCSVCVPLYITKCSEAVLQWGKRKNIKKSMINGKLVIE